MRPEPKYGLIWSKWQIAYWITKMNHRINCQVCFPGSWIVFIKKLLERF